MRITSNQNARNGRLSFLLLAFTCLAPFQPGCADGEDIDQLRKAAEQGDASAQAALGLMYDIGAGVAEDDVEAARWYLLAAQQGLASAQAALAVMYSRGEGVAQDYVEAAKWFRLAAQQGDALAQFNLGVMYSKGEGVVEDYVKAYAWWNLAAAQGNKNAGKGKDLLQTILTAEQVAEAHRLSAELRDRIKSSAVGVTIPDFR